MAEELRTCWVRIHLQKDFQAVLNCAYRLLRRGPDLFVPKIKGGDHPSLNLLRWGEHVFSGQSTLTLRPSRAFEESLTARASG
jgi:hypothetical protein